MFLCSDAFKKKDLLVTSLYVDVTMVTCLETLMLGSN